MKVCLHCGEKVDKMCITSDSMLAERPKCVLLRADCYPEVHAMLRAGF